MKLPRDLPGEELATKLCAIWHYRRVHQEGSHIVIETTEPSHHREIVILRQRSHTRF
jgi:hypothetical protein